jgi:exosome complex exonuclease DIS3/RRP44
VDGDVVVVALHPVDRWEGGGGATNHNHTTNGDDDDPMGNDGGSNGNRNQTKRHGGAVLAEETAEPTLRDETNVTDEIEVCASGTNGTDTVVSLRKPTGRVVGIVRRNFRRDYCGSIYSVASSSSSSSNKDTSTKEPNQTSSHSTIDPDPNSRSSLSAKYETEHPDGTVTCLFFAVDLRVPPVLIRTTQRDRLVGKRILIAIDSWPVDSEFPLGHYVRTIGESGEKGVETEVLLHEFDIPCDPFPVKVGLFSVLYFVRWGGTVWECVLLFFGVRVILSNDTCSSDTMIKIRKRNLRVDTILYSTKRNKLNSK